MAEQIDLLARLAHAASNTTGSSPDTAMGFGASVYGDITTAAAPRTAQEHFDAFLDSFGFPDGDARLLLTKQVADTLEDHGYPAVAGEMTRPYDEWPGGCGPANEESEPGPSDL